MEGSTVSCSGTSRKHKNGRVVIFVQRVTGLGWAYIHKEYIKRLVQVTSEEGRIRTTQEGKLEERRHEVRDHGHR